MANRSDTTGQPNLASYYAERAREHDRVYEKPERQNDLGKLRSSICNLLSGRSILEVACGTGYWTQFLATAARKILATDINEEVLAIARARLETCPQVEIAQDDAFRLAYTHETFDAGFAGYWWSHVRKAELPGFLDLFHARLSPGARVVFIDNRFVTGSSTPISRLDDEGNSYQVRKLDDGRKFEVLKNFPSEDDLRQALAGRSAELHCEFLTYYWCLSYNVA